MHKHLWLKFDLRARPGSSNAEMCAAAIEQSAWADRNGLGTVLFGEHHGTEDGYNPSPVVIASAVAARTKEIRLQLGAILLPLHDPLRIAEDICVLDNISEGRVDLTVGVGYVPSEFQMFDRDLKDRASLADEGLVALKQAFTGDYFNYRGRRVRVTPKPVQSGGPRIWVGGAVTATALRAARHGDGLFPTVTTPEIVKTYRDECDRLSQPVGSIIDIGGVAAIHVSRDPERDWPRVAPGMMHDMNIYGRWARESGTNTPFYEIKSIEELKQSGQYLVLTPDECLDLLIRRSEEGRYTMLNPLCGGTDPDIAWESLELLESEVLPHLVDHYSQE